MRLQVFEHQVTDDLLKQINVSNMYGEAETTAKQQFEESKAKDWEDLLQGLMVRRMQWMYRQWKLRKKRRAKLWAMQTQIATNRRRIAQKIVTFCERLTLAAKVRAAFKRELLLTYQKVYDVNDGRVFWFNHLTKAAVWERPHLLWRYGDVPPPQPWSPIDVPIPLPEEAVEDMGDETKPPREQMFALHYWHATARRDLPRKPDGLPLCVQCRRGLAAMKCAQCTTNFCLPCYRQTHGSPFGFFQRRKPNSDEAQDMSEFCQFWTARVRLVLSHTLPIDITSLFLHLPIRRSAPAVQVLARAHVDGRDHPALRPVPDAKGGSRHALRHLQQRPVPPLLPPHPRARSRRPRVLAYIDFVAPCHLLAQIFV